ncbi:hypothetical protein ACFU96_44005 [Streptomyces sp. NPDC057620]|uniref:hypothetical protein n=1 Tax=Streptomyces sp. NPDC057620 TaxID=3346185 RepID=UPI0036A83AC0
MPVTCLVSAKSCGVTTAALALTLACARSSLLAECDPAGGTIRAGLLRGQVSAGYGLHHLAAAERVGPAELAQAFAAHLVPLDGSAGHRRALLGLTDPAQAAALTRTWSALSDVLHVMAESAGHDVFVDAGRLTLDAGRLHAVLTPAPLLHRADLVLLTVRGTEQSLTLARHLLGPLRAELAERGTGAEALGLLLIEDGPYRAHQVADALKVPVLAALPWDPAAAAYLGVGGKAPRGFARSRLLRYARTATEQATVFAARRQVHQRYPAPAHPHLAGLADLPDRPVSSRGAARG